MTQEIVVILFESFTMTLLSFLVGLDKGRGFEGFLWGFFLNVFGFLVIALRSEAPRKETPRLPPLVEIPMFLTFLRVDALCHLRELGLLTPEEFDLKLGLLAEEMTKGKKEWLHGQG